MNIITWLLLSGLIIYDIFCIDDLLSKFHQNTYKLRDFRAELKSYNEEALNFCEVKTFKYNRTTPAVNFTFNLKIDLQDKTEIIVQANKFLSNEYRHFPLRFQANLKKSVDANIVGLATMTKCGNIKTFYFYKNVTYHTCNFVFDETRFPPLVPTGRYQIEVTLYLYLNKEIAVVNGYIEIYTPIAYPKK